MTTLSSETIPIVFFKDMGLTRSQQMFTDLNKHAVNTSKSLNTLYDSSNKIAVITKKTVDKIKFFNSFTDKENDTLGKFSQKIFTLNNFYNANLKLVNGCEIKEKLEKYVYEYWNLLTLSVTEWVALVNHTITKKSLREDYIVTQGVVLLAFGKLGAFFFENEKYDFNVYLPKMKKINWLRDGEEWQYRTIINGRIVRKEANIELTYIHIKELIGIELSEKEKIFNERVINR